MSNVYKSYMGYATAGQWVKRVAGELGMTPRQFLDADIDVFDLLLSAENNPENGLIQGAFRGGMRWEVRYDPATVTVTGIKIYLDDVLAAEWSGAMTAQQFLDDDWPETLVYGSEQADALWTGDGTVFAGAGNDIIELGGNAIAYGEAGQDAFVVYWGGSHITLADYQPGEKILFDMYDSFQELGQAYQGWEAAGNGFTVHFAGSYSPAWSLTIQGASIDQMRLEDLLVGQAGRDAVYAPVMSALGIV